MKELERCGDVRKLLYLIKEEKRFPRWKPKRRIYHAHPLDDGIRRITVLENPFELRLLYEIDLYEIPIRGTRKMTYRFRLANLPCTIQQNWQAGLFGLPIDKSLVNFSIYV